MVTGLTSLRGDSLCEPSDQTPLLQEGSSTNYATNSSLPPTSSTVSETPIPQPSWSSLPHKAQLAVIVFARLAEPLSERSQTSYLFHQLRFFDPSLPPSEVVLQAGYLTATFAATQCLTAMWWGRAADSPRWGRKSVLVVGLLGSAAAALGMGFARTLREAVVWRALAGGVNGNVGVLRTMVSEVVGERRHQSRAFLLLPMCYNVGVIIGPLLSGFLADPVRAMPSVFGPGGVLGGGGEHGNKWLLAFPYALPNLLFASILGCAALAVMLGLDETHPQLRHEPDRGRRLGKMLVERCLGREKIHSPSTSFYAETWPADGSASLEGARLLADHDADVSPCVSPLETPGHQRHTAHAGGPSEADDGREEQRQQKPAAATRSSRLRALLTRNVLLTMLQRFLHALHMSAFYAIFSTLLPTPRASAAPTTSPLPTPRAFIIPGAHETAPRPPFFFLFFSGGLGLSTQKMGFASTTLGLLGLPLQILLYPHLVSRLGVRGSYRAFLPLSILAYVLLPLVVLVPEDRPGVMWTCLVGVLALQVVSRTFVNPATIMLVNDCAVGIPLPAGGDGGGGGSGIADTGAAGERGQMLGTIHGLAVTISSAARIIGPTAGGALLGWGLRNEFVALPLWLLAGVAGVNWIVLWWIRDVDME